MTTVPLIQLLLNCFHLPTDPMPNPFFLFLFRKQMNREAKKKSNEPK